MLHAGPGPCRIHEGVRAHLPPRLRPRHESRRNKSLTRCTTSGDKGYKSLLPPFRSRPTVCTQVGKQIWTFEQPMGFLSAAIGNPFPAKALAFAGQLAVQRMTVVRLRDGGLWVHSPLALTLECEEQLRRLGRVAHVVLPCTSPEHWYYGPRFVDAFPEALVWTVPEILYSEKGLPGFKDVRTPSIQALKRRERAPQSLNDVPPPEWGGQFEVAVLNGGPLFTAAAFLHKPSGTLLCSDLFLFVDDSYAPTAFARAAAKAAGIYEKWGTPVVKSLLARNEGERFVQRLLRWEWKGIVPSHGNIQMPPRGWSMLRQVRDDDGLTTARDVLAAFSID